MLCAQTFCRRSRPTGALVQQRGISRKERAANEGLREKLREFEVYEPNKHELMGHQALLAEYMKWRGPPKLQKQVLLRQIRALKPERHCSYKGQSIEDLKRELAELQNTKQATLE